MKTIHSLLAVFALSAGLLTATSAFAEHEHKDGNADHPAHKSEMKGQLVPVTEKDAAWAAKAKAEYPTNTCVVSGDKLEEMGKPQDFIYRESGKPDRLVRFCCKDCVKDFKADPAKYLNEIDAAVTNKADK